MKQQFSASTEFKASESDQLDRIIELLEQINGHINPPTWKKFLRYAVTHLFTILILAVLAYVSWKIWGIVDGISDKVDGLRGIMGDVKTYLGEVYGDLKFW